MAPGTPEQGLPLWRWQFVFPGIAAVAALAAVALTIVNITSRDGGQPPSTTVPVARLGPTAETATTPKLPTRTSTPSAPTSQARSSPKALLGRDVMPDATEPCRAPGVGTGAAWLPIPVRMDGHQYELGYQCNLVSRGSGSLTFTLGKAYRELHLFIGFADGTGSAGHRVRFELIADEKEYLTEPPTLDFGEVKELTVDVTGVSRLKLDVQELGAGSGSASPSQPVFPLPTLTGT